MEHNMTFALINGCTILEYRRVAARQFSHSSIVSEQVSTERRFELIPLRLVAANSPLRITCFFKVSTPRYKREVKLVSLNRLSQVGQLDTSERTTNLYQ